LSLVFVFAALFDPASTQVSVLDLWWRLYGEPRTWGVVEFVAWRSGFRARTLKFISSSDFLNRVYRSYRQYMLLGFRSGNPAFSSFGSQRAQPPSRSAQDQPCIRGECGRSDITTAKLDGEVQLD
jgi:hypothetical protein